MSRPKGPAPKTTVIYAPIKRFRVTFCRRCEDRQWCITHEDQELRCILANIAESLNKQAYLNTLRGAHL